MTTSVTYGIEFATYICISISSDELPIILSGLVFVHPVMTIVSIMWRTNIMDITPIWLVFSAVCFVTLWVILDLIRVSKDDRNLYLSKDIIAKQTGRVGLNRIKTLARI
jgi:hypothetical protein